MIYPRMSDNVSGSGCLLQAKDDVSNRRKLLSVIGFQHSYVGIKESIAYDLAAQRSRWSRYACSSNFKIFAKLKILSLYPPDSFLEVGNIVGFARAIVALLDEGPSWGNSKVFFTTSCHGERKERYVRLRWGQSSGRIWRKIWPCRLTSHKVVSIQVKITTKSIRGAAGDKLRDFPRQRSHYYWRVKWRNCSDYSSTCFVGDETTCKSSIKVLLPVLLWMQIAQVGMIGEWLAQFCQMTNLWLMRCQLSDLYAVHLCNMQRLGF